MMENIIFGVVGTLIFATATYYNYRILQNFKKDSQVASSMFFLEDSSSTTFQVVSILVLTVLVGEGLIVIANYLPNTSNVITGLGKFSLIISMFAALYFVKTISGITDGPEKEVEK